MGITCLSVSQPQGARANVEDQATLPAGSHHDKQGRGLSYGKTPRQQRAGKACLHPLVRLAVSLVYPSSHDFLDAIRSIEVNVKLPPIISVVDSYGEDPSIRRPKGCVISVILGAKLETERLGDLIL